MAKADSAGFLSPLPTLLHHGLTAVVFFSFLSLTAAGFLFIYLAYRLVTWRHQTDARVNQYVALLLNLVLADLQQATGFAISARWIHENAIVPHTGACWTQGWLLNTGDVASGVFTFVMACHLFADVACDFRLSQATFLCTTVILWTAIYTCSTVGVIMHPNDFYVRADTWCWINEAYMRERLYVHYIWIVAAEFGVVIVYTALFTVLWKRSRGLFYGPQDQDGGLQVQARSAAKSILAYPIVYVVCTLPAVIARLKLFTGAHVTLPEFIMVGCFMTSTGWLDVLMYTITRRSLVFGPAPPSQETHGLHTFTAWTRYRADHYYGTTTTIEVGRERSDSVTPVMQHHHHTCVSHDGDKSIVLTATVDQTSREATEEEIEEAGRWEAERQQEQYPGDDDPSHMQLTFMTDQPGMALPGSNHGPQIYRTKS